MGLFFKKKDEQVREQNQYLKDQESLFDTKGEEKKEIKEESYDIYTFKPKDYSNVPKYKAFDEKEVSVVVDKDEFGFQDFNPNVETVNIRKENLHEDLNEIVNNAPIDEELKENNTSIYDEKLTKEIQVDVPIEIIDVESNNDVIFSDVVEQNVENEQKLSIFGNNDEPVHAKVYEVKEAPSQPKIEVIDVEVEEIVEEPKETIKLNEDGNKICPQCGAPLAPDAPVCFLCGNKF